MGEGGWENQRNASHTLRSKAGRRWNAVRSRVSDSARLSNPETGAEGSRCQVSVEEKNWKAHEKGPSLVWLALNQAIVTSRWWGRPSAPVTGVSVCAPLRAPENPRGLACPPPLLPTRPAGPCVLRGGQWPKPTVLLSGTCHLCWGDGTSLVEFLIFQQERKWDIPRRAPHPFSKSSYFSSFLWGKKGPLPRTLVSAPTLVNPGKRPDTGGSDPRGPCPIVG